MIFSFRLVMLESPSKIYPLNWFLNSPQLSTHLRLGYCFDHFYVLMRSDNVALLKRATTMPPIFLFVVDTCMKPEELKALKVCQTNVLINMASNLKFVLEFHPDVAEFVAYRGICRIDYLWSNGSTS